jgi:hypothetical protein
VHWINTFRKPRGVVDTELSLTDTTASTFWHSLKNSYGAWTIYLFMVARLFGCLVLFALSVNSLLGRQGNHPGVIDTVFKRPEVLMTVTFVILFPSFSSVIIPEVLQS